jgi:hypothetical protein
VAAHPSTASAIRIETVMTSFAAKAWNPAAPAARPSRLTGGLFVNYRAEWDGTSDVAANTNIRTGGDSDAQAEVSARHDPLTDLSILRNLDAMLSAGIRNTELDRLRCRLQPVTAAEFSDYGPARGWVYEALADLADLDPAGPWSVAARRYAETLADDYRSGLPNGSRGVRPDWVAECAAALVDAGARYAETAWTTTGHDLAHQLVELGANSATGLFPGQLDLDPNGVAVVKDPLVKVGSQAQLLDALLTVGRKTQDHELIRAVQTGLASLFSPTIGVLDRVRGGWFYAVDADGTQVRTDYKETRQAWLVPLFQDAAEVGVLDVKYANQQLGIVRDRLYQTHSGGYVYRVAPSFAPFASSQDGTYTQEDWISSEATGIAIQALLGPLKSI